MMHKIDITPNQEIQIPVFASDVQVIASVYTTHAPSGLLLAGLLREWYGDDYLTVDVFEDETDYMTIISSENPFLT